MMATPPTSAPQPGTNASMRRAGEEHRQRRERDLVRRHAACAPAGTTTTAASGRATKRFQRMSFGFRVRR